MNYLEIKETKINETQLHRFVDHFNLKSWSPFHSLKSESNVFFSYLVFTLNFLDEETAL
jgi:hypothetical protein